MRRLSGDQAGDHSATRGVRVRLRLPRPSDRTTQMSPASLRLGFTRYAMRPPPGAQDGENSSSGEAARRRGLVAPEGRR
jgi:hypothetical protein